MNRREAMEYVFDELDHISKKWGRKDGEFPVNDHRKMSILTEELGEVAMALNDGLLHEVKDELIQVAAVAVAWLMAEYHSKEEVASNVVS